MNIIKRPKFKRSFHVQIVEPEGVFLLSENNSFLLSGRLYQLLAPLIDGYHSVDDILKILDTKISAAEVYYGLMLMQKKGYIIETDDYIRPEVGAFWDILNVETKDVYTRFQETKLVVRNYGIVPRDQFILALKLLNIGVSEPGDIEVVLTDDYLQDDLAVCNQKALQSRRPWMLVKPVGTTIWIGPIFRPGETGCWECLAQRLRANRPVATFIQQRKNTSTPFPTSLSIFPSTLQTGLSIAATEIAKWIAQGNNKRLEGILITLDTISLEIENHVLVRRPQCPFCGNIKHDCNRKPLPIVLENRQKTFTTDGGHRCFTPEETVKKYEYHISPITGIVRNLKQISPPLNPFTYTYIAGHNFAMMFDDLYFLRENIRGRSAGKGKTDIQAKASGLCEAIERYSGVFQGDEIRQKGTYQKMGNAAIHPNMCMNFSQSQYENRQIWNAKSDLNQKVPEPFDETREIEWTPVWSITHQVFKYLPTAYCYYGYPKLTNPDCWADSNGNAAGNTIEEAILQGFMELVERDSASLWWYNRIKRPLVSLESFDDPYFQDLNNYYQTLNRQIWVLDITSDLNIPVFVAISRRTDKETEDIIFGFGAHFDPKLAILRALTETNQSLPAVSSVAADGSTEYPSYEQAAVNWWKTATLENQPYLVADTNVVAKICSDYSQSQSTDLLEDVMTCVEILNKKGMEMLVLDQTRPDIGLNVVKVIVPGMRHFWKRLAPGRLYDVPVQLGWLPEPLPENQLNPIPIFF
ncbi:MULTISPECIES: TOMM precursor leader peptide-binding protein [Aerosakkonema]|uniref:TOMM precursor leader peptide-binding protein n=1 Tax=Aerosakkonema TaxID=1246629 RepID=UPI0035B9DFE7